MAPVPTTETRLALLEDGLERLTDMIQSLTAEVRRSNEITGEVAMLRAAVSRVEGDLVNCGLRTQQVRDELNGRIDRTKGTLGEIEAKREEDNRKLWFWQGAAWGAGAMVAFTVGIVSYIAKGALDDIKVIQRDVHRIELEHQPRRPTVEPVL